MRTETAPTAPNRTEEHGPQPLDHYRDQLAASGGALAAVAKELLVAVADGDERSLEVATALAHAVLDNETFRRARQLEELARMRSPFALVRAVELAESLLIVTESVNMSAETSTSARSERK